MGVVAAINRLTSAPLKTKYLPGVLKKYAERRMIGYFARF